MELGGSLHRRGRYKGTGQKKIKEIKKAVLAGCAVLHIKRSRTDGIYKANAERNGS